MPDTTAPTLLGTTPENGATNVDPTVALILSFSEALDTQVASARP
ncbi:Ig-like domain-containing protein [Archangium lipolyticum]|nr:Ig-like domain-containing protein [Archangium lipolyticum]